MSEPDDQDKLQQKRNKQRYLSALHAVQSGVKFEIQNRKNDSHTPKHLRVGVNSAMIETSTLTRLLIAKGVFTWDEYFAQLADVAEEEQKRYEERNGVRFG